MRRVIIESPYAGNIDENINYARAAVRDSLLRGEAPIASHLLYTQPGILDDNDPLERAQGIDAGLIWGELAEATAVYADLGISPGMALGIARAETVGRPVEYRSIPGGVLPARGATPFIPREQADHGSRVFVLFGGCDGLVAREFDTTADGLNYLEHVEQLNMDALLVRADSLDAVKRNHAGWIDGREVVPA